MSFVHQYPYESYHEMNLDWVVGTVKDLKCIIDNKLEDMIREQLDKLFIDAMYDADTETLILTLGMNP